MSSVIGEWHLKAIPVETKGNTALDELLRFLRAAADGNAEVSVEDGKVKIALTKYEELNECADLGGMIEDFDREILYDKLAAENTRMIEKALDDMKETL